jgi:hypothetical protein
MTFANPMACKQRISVPQSHHRSVTGLQAFAVMPPAFNRRPNAEEQDS